MKTIIRLLVDDHTVVRQGLGPKAPSKSDKSGAARSSDFGASLRPSEIAAILAAILLDCIGRKMQIENIELDPWF